MPKRHFLFTTRLASVAIAPFSKPLRGFKSLLNIGNRNPETSRQISCNQLSSCQQYSWIKVTNYADSANGVKIIGIRFFNMENLLKNDRNPSPNPSTTQDNSLTAEEVRELREDLQCPVTYDYPELSRELIEIKDRIVNSFKEKDFSNLPPAVRQRMEEYQKILSDSNLRIVLSESEAVNAFNFVDKGIIVVNIGKIRSVLEQGLGVDSIAFTVGHEISHLLYEKSSILSEKEKRGILSNHDMEYQCDKDAVTLMDIAGYNPYVAPLFVYKEAEVLPDFLGRHSKLDFGVLSSHPEHEARRVRLTEVVENGIWENFKEGYVQDFTEESKAELIRDVQPSEQLKRVRSEFENRFFKELDEKLNSELAPTYLYNNNDSYDGFKIPEIFEEQLAALEERLKENNPEYKEKSMGIFMPAVSKTIDEFRFSFELEKGNDLSRLASNIEKYLPCHHEIVRGDKYDPFNDCMERLYGRYIKEIEPFFFKHDFKKLRDGGYSFTPAIIKSEKISEDQVADFIKVGLKKLGIDMFDPSSKIDIDELGNILEKVGSEKLVIHLASYEGLYLRDNKYCREVLDRSLKERIKHSQNIPVDTIPEDQWKEILFVPGYPKEIKEKIISHFVIDELQNKELRPLDLLMTFDAIREFGIDLAKVTAFKQKDGVDRDTNIGELFVSYVHEFTDVSGCTKKEKANVKKFWDEQLLSIGLLPYEVNSPKELANLLSDVPSDIPGSSFFEWKWGEKVTDCINAEKGKIYPYDSSLRAPFSNYLIAKLKEEEAFSLARFFKKVGFDTLENRGYFNKLKNVARYWRTACDRSVPREFLIKNDENSFTRTSAGRIADWIENKDRTTFLADDISENCLTEPIGPKIEFRDFIFYRYLRQTGYNDFIREKKEETVTRVEEYLPREGTFRDIVLANIYERNNFDEKLDDKGNKDFFIKFLSLYSKSSFRREAIAGKIYQAFRDDTQSLDDKLSFILTCFPHANLTRDEVIDEMLERHLENNDAGVSLSELHKVFNYYSSNDRSSERKESILDATLGAYVHNCSTEEKLSIAEWLFLDGIKPLIISNVERIEVHAKLDILLDLMSSSEIRHKTLEMIFFGKNGLAAEGNEEYFDRFIDDAFDKYFQPKADKPINEIYKELSHGLEFDTKLDDIYERYKTYIKKQQVIEKDTADKLVILGRELVKNTLHTVNPYKREKLLCRMFDLAQNESSKNIEAFLPKWVAGYSASAVKFLQIIGSRHEIKEIYPELHRRCEEAMSNAERMSMRNLIASLSTNPKLRSGDYKISTIIGSASMKVVLKGIGKDGEDVVIKALRLGVGRYTEEEAEELRTIGASLENTLKELFNLESVPLGVVDRACQAVKSETDLSLEFGNSVKLANAVRGLSNDEYTVTTPEVLFPGDNLIIERMGSGVTLKKYLEQPLNDEEKNEIARYVQAIYLNLLNKGIVLSDMHSGNVLVDKDKNGKFKFTLIDTGSLYQLEEDELKAFKKVLAGIVVSELEKNGGVETLLKSAIPSNIPFKSIIENKLSSMNIGETLSSERLLDGAIHELLGDEIYKSNRERINRCLQKMQEAESATVKPLMLMGLFDDLEDGIVPNSSYWSIVGLAKVFGLDRYQKENIPIYIETFGSTIKEELFSSGNNNLFGSLLNGLFG